MKSIPTLSTILDLLLSQFSRWSEIQIEAPGTPADGGFSHGPHADGEWCEGLPCSTAGTVGMFIPAGLILRGAIDAGLIGSTGINIEAIDSRLERALRFLISAQRESGCIDLFEANLDSAPDTAFLVQFIAVGELARRRLAPRQALAVSLDEVLQTFVKRAAAGICSGGFHTPNHRWVIASTLALAKHLWNGLSENRALIDGYLAEKVELDIDGEGAWTEHSVGVYDGVSNWAMLLLHEFSGHQPALACARRNLDFDLALIQPDGSVETGLSHRQDFGRQFFPVQLAATYLWMAALEPSDAYLAAAATILAAARPRLIDSVFTAFVLASFPNLAHTPAGELPGIRRIFPHNRILRDRNGSWSLSVFGGKENLLKARQGRARLEGLHIDVCYSGQGRFRPGAFHIEGEALRLVSEGGRIGYLRPAGRPIDASGDWNPQRDPSDFVAQPNLRSELRIEPGNQSCRLVFSTLEAIEGAMGQLAFDFAPGGAWQTESGLASTSPGQSIFHQKGMGRMWFGGDCLEISAGTCAHTILEMRGTNPNPKGVRVVLAFKTPAHLAFTLRGFTGSRLALG